MSIQCCEVFNYPISDYDTYKIRFPENAGFANKILIIAATLLLVNHELVIQLCYHM